MKIQHKRSNQLDGGLAKQPTSEFMEYGELAVNFNETDPAIFLKDSNDNIVRIAGAGANGNIEIPGAGSDPHQPGTSDDRYVEVTGDTMTGQLTLPGGGSGAEAIQVQEVEALINASDTGAGKYVEVAGDNMTGDLTLGTDKIKLDASDGSAMFASGGFDVDPNGRISVKRNDDLDVSYVFIIKDSSDTETIRFRARGDAEFAGGDISLNGDGSAKFLGNVVVDDNLIVGELGGTGNYSLQVNDGDILSTKQTVAGSGDAVQMLKFRIKNSLDETQLASLAGISAETIDKWGGVLTFYTKPSDTFPNGSVTKRMCIDENGNVGIGDTLPDAPNISLNADGSADFAGDATIHGLTVGRGSGSVDSNTTVGSDALLNNTTGGLNTAVGRLALQKNTEGNSNTALGTNALTNNTTGNLNTAVGRDALNANIEGNENSAIGRLALQENTTGDYNTAVGSEALLNNTHRRL